MASSTRGLVLAGIAALIGRSSLTQQAPARSQNAGPGVGRPRWSDGSPVDGTGMREPLPPGIRCFGAMMSALPGMNVSKMDDAALAEASSRRSGGPLTRPITGWPRKGLRISLYPHISRDVGATMREIVGEQRRFLRS